MCYYVNIIPDLEMFIILTFGAKRLSQFIA